MTSLSGNVDDRKPLTSLVKDLFGKLSSDCMNSSCSTHLSITEARQALQAVDLAYVARVSVDLS